jgi:REP element-mobilizing transposase RayT
MPTKPRQFEKNGFYHIYNRGNHREPVFYDDFDYSYFLRLIKTNADRYAVSIVAYCLMRNHYHFLIRQLDEHPQSITKFIGCSAMSYAHYFNKKYGQVGSVFQDKYKAKAVLTDTYLLHLSRYIHLNPHEFIDPHRYPWSSLRAYTDNEPTIADPSYILQMLNNQPYELGVLESNLPLTLGRG